MVARTTAALASKDVASSLEQLAKLAPNCRIALVESMPPGVAWVVHEDTIYVRTCPSHCRTTEALSDAATAMIAELTGGDLVPQRALVSIPGGLAG